MLTDTLSILGPGLLLGIFAGFAARSGFLTRSSIITYLVIFWLMSFVSYMHYGTGVYPSARFLADLFLFPFLNLLTVFIGGSFIWLMCMNIAEKSK